MSYYYYIEDDYCYYICHTEVGEVKLPLQKVNKYSEISENAVKNVVKNWLWRLQKDILMHIFSLIISSRDS